MTKQLHYLALTLLLLTQACGRIAISDTCACGFYTIAGTETELHLRDGEQIHFQFQKSFPAVYKLAIEESLRTYNTELNSTQIILDQTRDSGGTLTAATNAPDYGLEPTSVNGDGLNGIYWVSGKWPWEESDPKSAAMTVLQFSSEGIIEADVYFKASSYGRSPTSLETAVALFSPSKGYQIAEADTNSQWVYVLGVHEFGHVLGRTHNSIKGSVMNAAVGLDLVSNPLGDIDLKALATVYTLRK